ncbi:MAG: Unknown protein [uncultured Sulfurovum sp.]|uniref:FecR protein domain-containing protein n=1 Tax=uncultured Sulfurovum sp. TaxID=269237 RepID=A0A6S6U6F0_9BACT|nr:MAG: Unknown protein [uncultured Sulfurovum sp.]
MYFITIYPRIDDTIELYEREMIMKQIIVMIVMSNLLLANVGIVKNIIGKVELQRAQKVLLLHKGSAVNNGDIIMTKSKSSIGITFDDGTRLSLGENAIFVINKFKVDPAKKEYDVDLNLKKGKAVFSSGKVGKLAPESVKFRIPEGIIGIRGTKFAVEVK